MIFKSNHLQRVLAEALSITIMLNKVNNKWVIFSHKFCPPVSDAFQGSLSRVYDLMTGCEIIYKVSPV